MGIRSRSARRSGSLEPIRITAPAGSILNALKPSAVYARNSIGQMLPDMAFGCLRHVIPNPVPAEGAGTLWNISLWDKCQTNEGVNAMFRAMLINSGGMGALADRL